MEPWLNHAIRKKAGSSTSWLRVPKAQRLSMHKGEECIGGG
jgi:hypothetical protein